MQIVTTQEHDVLDGIIWAVFSECTDALLANVYSLNPGLADHGPTLPAGLTITLPDTVPPPPQSQDTGIKLWD